MIGKTSFDKKEKKRILLKHKTAFCVKCVNFVNV